MVSRILELRDLYVVEIRGDLAEGSVVIKVSSCLRMGDGGWEEGCADRISGVGLGTVKQVYIRAHAPDKIEGLSGLPRH